MLRQIWQHRDLRICWNTFFCATSYGTNTAGPVAWCDWGRRCSPGRITFLGLTTISLRNYTSKTHVRTRIIIWYWGTSLAPPWGNIHSTSCGAHGSLCVPCICQPGRIGFFWSFVRRCQNLRCERREATHKSHWKYWGFSTQECLCASNPRNTHGYSDVLGAISSPSSSCTDINGGRWLEFSLRHSYTFPLPWLNRPGQVWMGGTRRRTTALYCPPGSPSSWSRKSGLPSIKLYSPPGENIPMLVEPFVVYYSVPEEEEIELAMKRFRYNRSGGELEMWLEHLRKWLAEASYTDTPDATNW